VLLAGNVHLADTADGNALVSSFLHSLTSSTWGVSISLPDMLTGHHHSDEGVARKKVDKKLKATATDLVDLVSTAYMKDRVADTRDYGQ
jgi:hypothetical protein